MRRTLHADATGPDFRYWLLFVDLDGSATVYRDGSALAKLAAADALEIYRSEPEGEARMAKLIAALEGRSKKRIAPEVREKFLDHAQWLVDRFGC